MTIKSMSKVKLGILQFDSESITDKHLENGVRVITIKGKVPMKQQNILLNQMMKKPVLLRIEDQSEMNVNARQYIFKEEDDELSFTLELHEFQPEKDLDTLTLLSIDSIFARLRIRSLLNILEKKGIIDPHEYEEVFEQHSHRDSEDVMSNIMEIGVRDETSEERKKGKVPHHHNH
jgi:predicted transcriptional regulator